MAWLGLLSLTLAYGQATEALDQKVNLAFTEPRLGTSTVTGPLNLEDYQGKAKLVLFFLNEQCGVTFYYRDRVRRLQKDFAPLGYKFLGVRCGKRQTSVSGPDLPEARTFDMPFIDDADGRLWRMFKVAQSATFAVIDTERRLRYLGGFDDSVAESQVRRPYLRTAMRQVSRGQAVAQKVGPAIGCAILPPDGNP